MAEPASCDLTHDRQRMKCVVRAVSCIHPAPIPLHALLGGSLPCPRRLSL